MEPREISTCMANGTIICIDRDCYRRPENQQFLTVKKPAKPNYEHSNALYAKACGTRLRTHHGSWSRKYHQPNWPTTGAG